MPLATIMMTFLHKMGTYFQPSFATYEPELFGKMLTDFRKQFLQSLGGFHKWRQHPRGEGGLVKCWQNLTWGEGGFDQWWRQQKRTFCCNRNKYKNKNTQLLNLSSNSAILPNMIFYGTKMCIRQVSAGCNFFRYKFCENCSQKGGYAQVWHHYLGGVFKVWQTLT